MDLKGALYRTGMVAWAALVFGAWIAVDAGYAGPGVSFAAVPGGSTGAFAGAMVVVALGLLVLGFLQRHHEADQWEAAGRQAGLEPTDGGTPPELTGTVDGRTVTARYEKRRRSAGPEGGTRSVTFTFADAALSGPAEDGLVVGPAGGSVSVEDGTGTIDLDDLAETAPEAGLVAGETDDLVLVGTSGAVVETVAEGLSGRALHAIRDLQIVAAGDAAGLVAGWAETRNEALEGSIVEYPVANLAGRVPGDAGTVTVEAKTAIRDGDQLRRFTEGAVAIADAFEDATARVPASE